MNIQRIKNGFSLIEVIISIFIISIFLAGVLILVNDSLKQAQFSKMKLIAAGLAQEGIELIVDTRRSNFNWSDWYDWISNGDYLVQYDTVQGTIMPFSETPLKFDASTGLYQYNSGINTPYYRKITLNKVSNREAKILSEVKWIFKGNWHYLKAENRLWNWK